MDCGICLRIFGTVGNALNSPIETKELLNLVARTLVDQFRLLGCHIRLLSRDKRILEGVASHGLSQEFLDKGPVDADKSVSAALDGNIVTIQDCATDPRIQYRQAFVREGISTMVTVPLRSRGQVIGVMRLSSSEKREFGRDELEILDVVASFVASAIIHSMFHRILARVTESIHASLDPEGLLNTIVRVISEDLRAKGCTIQLLDDSTRRLKTVAVDGLSERYLTGTANRSSEAVAQALQGLCVSVLNARLDPRVPSIELAEAEGIGSMLFVPLAVQEQTLGVLCLYTNDSYEFSQDELYLMQSIGDHCALAIRNAQMYAAIKRQYENLTVDFQRWFEHVHSGPGPDKAPTS